jgi:hypothetical protein
VEARHDVVSRYQRCPLDGKGLKGPEVTCCSALLPIISFRSRSNRLLACEVTLRVKLSAFEVNLLLLLLLLLQDWCAACHRRQLPAAAQAGLSGTRARCGFVTVGTRK